MTCAIASDAWLKQFARNDLEDAGCANLANQSIQIGTDGGLEEAPLFAR